MHSKFPRLTFVEQIKVIKEFKLNLNKEKYYEKCLCYVFQPTCFVRVCVNEPLACNFEYLFKAKIFKPNKIQNISDTRSRGHNVAWKESNRG